MASSRFMPLHLLLLQYPIKPAISLQQLPVIIPFQYLHLLNGNLIEFNESFTLWHAVVDENSVYILHIRKAYQFIYSSIVADVAFQFWIGFAPLLGCHAEHSDVEHIGLSLR